jgi:glycosyltransferase involved in cell wall biosynthesis
MENSTERSGDASKGLPKLTVIIPTINRPDTLYFTLRTVVNQEYPLLSIIVSDNFSNDNTEEVVRSFSDSRIRYINPGRRLSMSHHWEFALQHVDDGFVTVLGDDDGILPGGLKRIGTIISRHNVRAVGWRFGNFNWKGLPPYFMIPMADYYRVVDAHKEVEKIFRQSIYRTIQFPSLYGGFIDVQLIKELRAKNGTFFHSRIPDFFTGGMMAATLKNYIRAEFPITINATSRHSTGYSTINDKSDQKAFIDLTKQDNNIPFHEKLIFYRSNAIPIAEAMLQVHRLVPTFPAVDIKKLLQEIVDEASRVNSEAVYRELLEGVTKIGARNGLEEFASVLVKTASYHPLPEVIKQKFSPVSLSLYINTTNSGIDNVEDACLFAASVIPKSMRQAQSALSINFSRLRALTKHASTKLFGRKSNQPKSSIISTEQ